MCIIDDREDVWNFAPNLVHVKPYHFFKNTGDINAPPGLSKQEKDKEVEVGKNQDSGKEGVEDMKSAHPEDSSSEDEPQEEEPKDNKVKKLTF